MYNPPTHPPKLLYNHELEIDYRVYNIAIICMYTNGNNRGSGGILLVYVVSPEAVSEVAIAYPLCNFQQLYLIRALY